MSSDAPAASGGEPVISCVGLGKAYTLYERPHHRLLELCGLRPKDKATHRWALRGIDFCVARGECVGIIGQNGAGKSTLLQMIAGTVRPTEGHAKAHGRVAALLELSSGFNPELTGRENIGLRAAVLGLTNAQIAERTPAIIAFAELESRINDPIRTYSTGMQARLAFSIAAHVDADVLIVDETLAVGDAMFVQKCMRWIRAFKSRGTLLFVSHSTQVVTDLCDRALWIEQGRAIADGPAKDIVRDYSAAVHGKVVGQGMTTGKGLNDQAQQDKQPASADDPTNNPPQPPQEPRDQRTPALRDLGLEAVLEGMRFNPDADWWGRGGATVESVRLLDQQGNPAARLPPEGLVTIEVRCVANERLEHPVVGYSISNSRAMVLFADNSWLAFGPEGSPPIEAGTRFVTRFRLRIPALPAGNYMLGGAVADGTPGNFIQHHRSDDAMLFRVASSHLVEGIAGATMLGCTIEPINHSTPAPAPPGVRT